MAEENPNYVKGFTAGYKLARFEPEIFELLKDSLNIENEFHKAILDGGEQWFEEKQKARETELQQMRGGNERKQEKGPEQE